MMKKILKQEKGVTLISLAAVIIVMGIITTMLMYSIRDTNDTGKLTDLYSDIDNLTDKVSNYYATYGQIPAISTEESENIITEIASVVSDWEDTPVGANDTGRFLVLDLNAIENLTLNYGKEFEKIKDNIRNENYTIGSYRDFYIINENSHNIFYLKGVKVNNKKYYTNQDKDTEAVNLRYIEGIKIPDGYNYLSGTKATGIIITNGTKQYIYEDGIYKNYVEDGEGDGTTISVELTENDERAWSLPYETTTIYKDSNGDTCYIPAGFMVSKLDDLNQINKGLVIKKYTPDSDIATGKTRMDYGDEYVWISVPFSAMKNATIKPIDANSSVDDINNASKEIEDALINYAKSYRKEGFNDLYYDGCGIANSTEYVKLKYNLLKSIYENGGFYVGRYEAGCNTQRTAGSIEYTANEVETTSGKPLSQKEKNPYNWVTVSQAQGLSNSVSEENTNYTTSLMFGIQWDLICLLTKDLNETTQNKIYNIYNLSGNLAEFTLENSDNTQAVARGDFENSSLMSNRETTNINSVDANYGFRVCLFK